MASTNVVPGAATPHGALMFSVHASLQYEHHTHLTATYRVSANCCVLTVFMTTMSACPMMFVAYGMLIEINGSIERR
jgi:hypothetical protein